MQWPVYHKLKNRLQSIELPREDRVLMMLCLGISFTFWLLIKLSQVYETPALVSIAYVIPAGKAFIYAPPLEAEVGLKGTGWRLLRSYALRKRIGLRYKINADTQTTINGDMLKSDISRQLRNSGLHISYVRYAPINLKLEDDHMKVVPVLLQHDIKLAKEYRFMKPIALVPDSVAISGPTSLLKKITSWPTELYQANELKESATLTIKLVQTRPELRLATQNVQALIEVEQITTKEIFLPISIRNATSDSVRFFPDHVKATCVVGLSAYDELDAADFSLVVDFAKVPLGKGNNTAPILIEKMPKGVDFIQLSKKSVEFLIVEEQN